MFVKRTPRQLLEFLEKVRTGEIDGLVAGAADFEAVGCLDLEFNFDPIAKVSKLCVF